MKKLIPLLLVLALLLSLSVGVFAAKDLGYLQDHANLLTPYQQQSVSDQAAQLSAKYNIHISIVTTDTTNGMDTYAYAENYYHSNDMGMGEAYSGILLLISFDAVTGRGWAVYTCNEGYDVLSDTASEYIMQDVTPLLSAGAYYDAFTKYLQLLDETIYDYLNVTPDDVLFTIVIALGIGAVVGLITILIMRAGMKSSVYQHGAGQYIVEGSYDLRNCHDIFLYSHVTKIRRSTDSGGRGGSGRSGSGSMRSGGSSGRF